MKLVAIARVKNELDIVEALSAIMLSTLIKLSCSTMGVVTVPTKLSNSYGRSTMTWLFYAKQQLGILSVSI